MKQIYFYDAQSKLFKATDNNFLVTDDWEPSEGVTDKVPDFSKRVRFIIKWGGEDWVYAKRDSILWTHITDTPEHRERKQYYDTALSYYNKIHQLSKPEHEPDNNPDDLLQFLKDNVDAKVDAAGETYTLEDTIKWIENYEANKVL